VLARVEVALDGGEREENGAMGLGWQRELMPYVSLGCAPEHPPF